MKVLARDLHKWEEELSWNGTWKNARQKKKKTKLRQFKILNRLYCTPSKLFTMGLQEDSECPKCSSTDGILKNVLFVYVHFQFPILSSLQNACILWCCFVLLILACWYELWKVDLSCWCLWEFFLRWFVSELMPALWVLGYAAKYSALGQDL